MLCSSKLVVACAAFAWLSGCDRAGGANPSTDARPPDAGSWDADVQGGSEDGHGPHPCEGIDCSGHGRCVVRAGEPTCECDEGYEPRDLTCVAILPEAIAGDFLFVDEHLASGVDFFGKGRFFAEARPISERLAQELRFYEDVPLDDCTYSHYETVDGTPVGRWMDAGDELVFSHGQDLVLMVVGEILQEPYYLTQEGTLLPFVPGDAYVLSGQGGIDIGPFEASVVAPQRVEITETHPERLPGDTDVVVSRDQDVVFRWVARDGTPLIVRLIQWNLDDSGGAQVVCRFSDDGEGTIPASLLSRLNPTPPDSEFPDATLDAMRYTQTTFQPPGAAAPVLIRFQSAWFAWARLQ